ncbi:MAG: hypothetical protein KAV70_04985, partial [Bacteroidales bacterium]|nr:hypothetical protein [Bacteroidales bacterium]
MKTLKLSVLVCALVTLTSTINYVKSQDAVQILKQMDDVMYAPKDQDSKIKLVLIDKNDKEKTREATV